MREKSNALEKRDYLSESNRAAVCPDAATLSSINSCLWSSQWEKIISISSTKIEEMPRDMPSPKTNPRRKNSESKLGKPRVPPTKNIKQWEQTIFIFKILINSIYNYREKEKDATQDFPCGSHLCPTHSHAISRTYLMHVLLSAE